MKIAVTGASGFIGRPVMRKLNSMQGVEAAAVTRADTDYSVESLRECIKGADAVIHLAGVKGGTGSISDFHVNELITENLLTAMAEENVPKIVFASSRLVYSDPDKIPWREDSLPEPLTMYGISKVSCEALCRLFGERHGISCTSVRIAQVLGPDEGTRNMMNVFLENAQAGKQLRVMGKSVARRQYIYVEDLADILITFAMNESRGFTVVNAGMEKAYTNLEIAQMISSVFDDPEPVDYDDSFEETITSSEMDISILIKKTGTAPRDMEQALKDMREKINSN